MMREQAFIDWIVSRSDPDPHAVAVGPGDDCAVITLGGEQALVTVDQVLDGVHGDLSRDGALALGRKALARNLSDIAAMAGTAVAAVVSTTLPKGLSDADCRAIYEGLREIGDAFDCPVAGGDVAAWDGALSISVTVIGRPGPRGAILRSGARVGDALCVTGQLGGAWKGDHHLTFTPRIAEALSIAAAADVHAMIDISDGLTTDLGHLCSASGIGAEIDASAIPLRDGADLTAALNDGEDYELLLAVAADQVPAAVAATQTPVMCIGRVTQGREMVLSGPNGRRDVLTASGWEHRT